MAASDAELLADLPEYVSKLTSEERVARRVFAREQIQILCRVDCMAVIKITCSCGKRRVWWNMYRCLYCGVFYCKECAQFHFGMRVQEFKEADHE